MAVEYAKPGARPFLELGGAFYVLPEIASLEKQIGGSAHKLLWLFQNLLLYLAPYFAMALLSQSVQRKSAG
jgi:hypothetical protein